MSDEMELNPIDRLTAGYVGEPGARTFYIQIDYENRLISLLCEKQQVQSLSIGVERFIKSLHQKYPALPETIGHYDNEEMALREPIDPLFRVGDIGLGYDDASDQLVLAISEVRTDEESGEIQSGQVIRAWATREQLMAFSKYSAIVVKQGRPMFHERRNGHSH